MNIQTFDLNLLLAFDALYRERSVTRAGGRIGLSQPSMSNALTRLRKLCDDPLFVRTRAGMEPTPLAQKLAGPVQQGLEVLKIGLEQPFGFDPASSDRTFRLVMSDIAEITVLPRLMSALKRVAPQVNIVATQVPREQFRSVLENGEADLALGNLPELKSGFYQQRLFQDHYACLARHDHPDVGERLSMRQYIRGSHVRVSTSVGDTMVERELTKRGLQRRIALQVPHFLVVTVIVMSSDLLVSVPYTVVSTLHLQNRVKVLRLPFTIPDANVRQFWHQRYHHDPANRWLRRLIAEVFLDEAGR
jgi:DNA-binding transcriptional LysR family regulator